MTLRRLFAGLLCVLPWALSGCETLEPGGQTFNILSTEQEIALGREVAAEVEKEEKLYSDPALQAYVSGIGERLARVATRQDVPYTFKVIDAPDTVNAFALPGGNMYVYTGLLKLMENEAELAGVMAHEIAHVAAHHHGETLTRQYGYEVLAGLILGRNPGAAAQLAAGLVGKTVASRYSREQEREADALGMEFLFRAGFNPNGMVSFMQKMQALEAREGGARWFPIFASHPPTQERLQNLQALILRYPPDLVAKSPSYPERYRQNVTARLNADK